MTTLLPCIMLSVTTACSSGAKSDSASPPPAPLVSTAIIKDTSLGVEWTFMGEVESEGRAQMSAGADGELVRILVEEGSVVKKGQLLALVDPSVASAQLQASQAAAKQAEVEESQAQSEAERFSQAGSKLVTGLEIERARAQAASKEAMRQNLSAQQQQVRAQLARHQVRAPFDGVVSQRYADPGDWLIPGTPLLEVVSEKAPDIIVRAGSEMLDYIHRGSKATLARGDNKVSATVQGVVRALDPGTRTVTFRLTPDETQNWLLAGSTCDVVLSADISSDDALVVPRDAVVPSAINNRVFKVENKKAIALPVEIIQRGTDGILVRAKELKLGDKVVTRGNERLRPGQEIREAN
ncbi:MAG: efflux RND transporter periplasmic adaptor subunit [Myxococcales bacterium]|nr:MAG: efflux RND transporter periplasmic adaptor subunit [Myxococcales bacterium]